MLTESTLLGLAGGGVAIPMAVWGFNTVKLLGAQSVPRLEQAQLDVRALAFTFAVSLLAGIACGLIPALRVSRLRIGGRSNALPQALVAAQLALAVVLLAGGALMIRSFLAVLAVDPGFTPQGVLTVELRRANRAPGIVDEITTRLRSLPGVQAVGTVNDVLLLDNVKWGEAESGRCTMEVEGQPSFANETCGPSYTPPNSGEALQALGLRLRRGRWFTDADGPGAPTVALINEAMMRRFWRGQDPVGTRFRGCGRCPWVTVAGVVGDIHHVGLERDAVLQWFPAPLQSKPGATVVIRATGDLTQLAPMVRKAIREVDRGAAIWQVDSLERQLEAQVAGRRLQAWLLGILSAIALLLAGIGIYGVMHYSVAQRTREIGVRMALGARPREVLGMVLRQGLTLTATGVVAGLAAAFWVTKTISALLFGVQPHDPGVLAGVAGVLFLVALAASYVPARRATRVDPMAALRCD
jgi:predicted permease